MDERLTEIYDFIQTYKAKHGYSPSHEDIAEAMGVSKFTVFHDMETMENLGMLMQPRGLLRAIKLLSRQPDGHTVLDSREGTY